MFLSRNMKKIRIFYLEIFNFLVVKFSVYLNRSSIGWPFIVPPCTTNRRVFVMSMQVCSLVWFFPVHIWQVIVLYVVIIVQIMQDNFCHFCTKPILRLYIQFGIASSSQLKWVTTRSVLVQELKQNFSSKYQYTSYMETSLAPDKRGILHTIFLISPQKHVVGTH